MSSTELEELILEDVAAVAVRGMLAAGYERAVALIAELRAEATK